MQSIEVMVFFAFAVMIGFLVIGFLVGFDFEKMQENLASLLMPQPIEERDFEKISYNSFIGRVSECWTACSFGQLDKNCGLYHIEVESQKDYGKKITKTELEKDFNKFNICETCRIELNPAELTIPGTYALGCDEKKEAIIIKE